ncbi:MAG: bifunctional 4-hydroxy-2-oxoglutarate aldolase/2-dehydro-3-deoxy-phosphogluconate aldolase [Cellvibrionales bacterium]|nr:bifunctional 4-hydroxy-2-oxoglutarate aldolase/2-dehydro-3-deoxy-phosphogluconate aldolase [Cellvibrionales bacterium]
MWNIREVIPNKSIVPVLVIDDEAHAEPLAEVLMNSGINAIEVTLRTGAALPAIANIKRHLPQLKVGAGTANTPELFSKAVDAGADFIMTPGFTEALIVQSQKHQVPFIPGVSTLSEMMLLHDQGFSLLKLFPAEIVGGVSLLKAIEAVLPDLSFCPTGGISEKTCSEYLALNNVSALGGSWVATREDIQSERWDAIKNKARRLV